MHEYGDDFYAFLSSFAVAVGAARGARGAGGNRRAGAWSISAAGKRVAQRLEGGRPRRVWG
ncbi:MAG: hypothetical protein WDN04_11845 [Rhodospirillales bacterium]